MVGSTGTGGSSTRQVTVAWVRAGATTISTVSAAKAEPLRWVNGAAPGNTADTAMVRTSMIAQKRPANARGSRLNTMMT